MRNAMHGDADDLRALDPDESNHWLKDGRDAEAVVVTMLGSPPINVWLQTPEAQADVAAIAAGDQSS
jgi:hypothetical protein